jgi:hypothetical protein
VDFQAVCKYNEKGEIMNIKKTILTAVAIFAAIAVCQAKLSASSESEESTSSESTSSSSSVTPGDGESLTFSLDEEELEEIDGYEVLTEFLPGGVALEWTGKKLKAPKSGKVKYSKKDEGFVDTKDSENPSGLSVKYNKKSGKVSGSFKIYVAKSEKKLKSYSAKFSGTLGDEMKVSVKGKQVGTATIQ